jgi:uncharacterized protein
MAPVLADLVTGPMAVAVSGDVNSMTLAVFAHRLLGRSKVVMMHGVSAGVAPEATERVRAWAQVEGWDLQILGAGGAGHDEIRNPLRRWALWKHQLYGAMAALTDRQIFSGVTVADCPEAGPRLQGATQRGVRHPYREVGMGKTDVRFLARAMGMRAFMVPPAAMGHGEAPFAIEPTVLAAIAAVETLVAQWLMPAMVRCRVRHDCIAIELDQQSLQRMDAGTRANVAQAAVRLFRSVVSSRPVVFLPDQTGRALIGARL